MGSTGSGPVADFQSAVPLRTYEALWNDYLRDRYPVFENLTWPGRIPYLALTSGTTQGATKYIPVSREMVASNRKAAQTMVAHHLTARPESRLFHGRLFFLGGTANLEEPAPGVRQGDLSGIAAIELSEFLRPYTFPPLALALESNWDRKLALLAEQSMRERITLVSGVPSWLLMLFQRVLELSGKSTISEVWPELEIVVHGGVKFDPYQNAFRADSGQRLDSPPGDLSLLRGIHRLRRPRDRTPAAVAGSWHLLRVRPRGRAGRLGSHSPLAGNRRDRGQLRHRGVDVRRDVGPRDRRYHSLRIARPSLDRVHGTNPVHAFGVR